MFTAFPFQVSRDGRTASATRAEYVRQLIEQVLFTVPGERVNRPEFGCGLQRLLFEPNSGQLSTATQVLVRGALQQWLGDWIEVEEVVAECEDARLAITVRYRCRKTGAQQVEHFSQ